ncbi:hypothetical protein [Acidipila rosea]|uniref:Sel1 repeat-containing protein n=1 Tax=Acidipila rosea TaxID=768535 RepID=A0A4R1L653_9BACT|nr:hypothetical protein [Acidipila rosea]TCK73648.1 hypothetical protein C7378_1261 [Acidipila rosea]
MVLRRPIGLTLVLAVCAASSPSLRAMADASGDTPYTLSYEQKLSAARAEFFADLNGDHGADEAAHRDFSALSAERPGDPVILAYLGSLDLLEAGRTWAIWNKRALSQRGLTKLDTAVKTAPGNLEARFIRGASTWHLPSLFHRREQAESDFAYIAPQAEEAARNGTLPPQLAAAALDYYGQVLEDHSDSEGAKHWFAAAVRVDKLSPGGKDALKHLQSE